MHNGLWKIGDSYCFCMKATFAWAAMDHSLFAVLTKDATGVFAVNSKACIGNHDVGGLSYTMELAAFVSSEK